MAHRKFTPIVIGILFFLSLSHPLSLRAQELWVLDENYESTCFKIFNPGPMDLRKGDMIIIRFDVKVECGGLSYGHIDIGKKGIVKLVNGGWHLFEPRGGFENYSYAIVIKGAKRGSDSIVITLSDETFIYEVTVK